MSDENNKDINKEEESKTEENQSEGVNTPADDAPVDDNAQQNQNQDEKQPESENIQANDVASTSSEQPSTETSENSETKTEDKKEHEVIHKKDGRLHIYVRQDKYKGELKSKNWVGRLYIDGKQKISSSGTPNLEEAIPILEKWFDDVQSNKGKEETVPEETQVSTSEQSSVSQEQVTPQVTSTPPVAEATSIEKTSEPVAVKTVTAPIEETKTEEPKNVMGGMLNKLKAFKFKKPSFGGGDKAANISAKGKIDFKGKLEGFFKSRLGKSTAQGEEIVGVEITNKEIRLSQISSNKANQWVLENFFIHKVDLPEDATVLDNADKLGGELSVALQKAKIKTPNAAIAIPVTSAIIRVVTAPLMKEEELQKAIETNSLWENLVQLTDNLDDYSIFHQVINRNQKENTMDILFVASKLSDINSYTSIIKSGGLNPVIIDVKCFALKSAVDQINQISRKTEDANLTAVLEFGLDENYLMILYDNNPIITDIFLRGQDRKILFDSQNQEEMESLVRRYTTQVKQAVQDFETKYEKRIRSIKVVSDLNNLDNYLSHFRKNLVNIGFTPFDPVDGLKIPQQIEERINMPNKSYLSTVVGLAFRKLDVFGYYKFVTAVKNINLLPDRQGMFKKKKMKAISNFAFKGVAGGIAAIYLILFGLSFWNIHSYNKKLENYAQVKLLNETKGKEFKIKAKELKLITTALKLSNSLTSNKDLSYRILAQIASSVPKRVKFNSVDYNGKRNVVIQGIAASDQDILRFIENLGNQKLIEQASLSSMKLPSYKSGQVTMKGFRVFVKIDPNAKG